MAGVPLAPNCDFRIDDILSPAPNGCASPVLLIRSAGNRTWFAAGFPKLVTSGGHDPAFEAVCDVLAEGIGARREVLAGRGHTIPALGDAYNALLEEFLSAAR